MRSTAEDKCLFVLQDCPPRRFVLVDLIKVLGLVCSPSTIIYASARLLAEHPTQTMVN